MSIRALIDSKFTTLTPSERKLATVLLSDYPYAGLVPIQTFSDRAEVSAPSISRFVSKLGLLGYADLQRKLVQELKMGQRSPVDVYNAGESIQSGYLHEFLKRVAAQIQFVESVVTEAQFEQICKLLSNPRRRVFVMGGRVSDTIAYHFSFHLRQTRAGVIHIPRDPETWPEFLLRTKQGDVFFLVDFRRYQGTIESLAQRASKQGAKVILMTDKWLSPAHRYAAEVIAVPIETGTVWDSYAAALALVEALVSKIAESGWEDTRFRIEAWDALRLSQEETPS